MQVLQTNAIEQAFGKLPLICQNSDMKTKEQGHLHSIHIFNQTEKRKNNLNVLKLDSVSKYLKTSLSPDPSSFTYKQHRAKQLHKYEIFT